MDLTGDHFPLWGCEINHEYLGQISFFLFPSLWAFSGKSSTDSVQSITDLNPTLNYRVIIIKGVSAHQCFKPGGWILFESF